MRETRYFKCEQKSVIWYGKLLSEEENTISIGLFNVCGCFITLKKKDWQVTELRTLEQIDTLTAKLKQALKDKV